LEHKITLYTETVIDSCHKLNAYEGACCRLHGHSWYIKVWIQGEDSQKDQVGILFDFGNIKIIKDELDHRYLNEIEPFTEINPTAENISLYLLEKLKNFNNILDYRIRVYETAIGKETYCQRQTENFDIKYL
jgi:6-pyruvoyltetrahydropterin/6-carboxytetrahydropterin synthase